MGDGLRRAGEPGPAWTIIKTCWDLAPGQAAFDQVEDTLLVRHDRWVESRLTEMRTSAPQQWSARIEQLARRCATGLGEQLPQAGQDGGAAYRGVAKRQDRSSYFAGQTSGLSLGGHIRDVGPPNAEPPQLVDSI